MSGVDTSIYQNLLRPPKSVAEYDAEALSNQQNRLALQMSQAQLADRQRAIDDGNKLRQAVAGFGADKTANSNALLQGGFLKEAQAYDKSNSDITKASTDVEKTKQETLKMQKESAAHQFEIAGQLASAWSTNPGITKAQIQAGLNAAAHSGVISPEITQAKMTELESLPDNPMALNGWAKGTLQQVMKAKDSMSYIAPDAGQVLAAKTQVDTNAATNATSRANNAATNATTQRGQNLTNDRALETAKAGKVPSGYRLGKDGVSLEAIPGGPADNKPLTESQGKAALFTSRMDKADKIMTDIIASGTKTPAMLAGMPGGNFTANANQQKLEQSQRDFVNAVLRQESGAAIGKDEFDSAAKQYFPQRGDTPEVIQQKAENRRTAIQGMGLIAGPGMAKVPTPSAAPSTPAKNAKGWALHTDANGNKAYVSPDGKQFQEVQ